MDVIELGVEWNLVGQLFKYPCQWLIASYICLQGRWHMVQNGTFHRIQGGGGSIIAMHGVQFCYFAGFGCIRIFTYSLVNTNF